MSDAWLKRMSIAQYIYDAKSDISRSRTVLYTEPKIGAKTILLADR